MEKKLSPMWTRFFVYRCKHTNAIEGGNQMELFYTIHTRRSVRRYQKRSVSSSHIEQILNAAITAPSGKNLMPWRFRVITDENTIETLADKTKYSRWLRTVPVCVVVMLDKNKSYNIVKDAQSCGAVMQTMLLAARGLGLGSCWIGEVLDYQDDILQHLNIAIEEYELMGLVAIGYSEERTLPSKMLHWDDFII